jgi:hypothetical protein
MCQSLELFEFLIEPVFLGRQRDPLLDCSGDISVRSMVGIDLVNNDHRSSREEDMGAEPAGLIADKVPLHIRRLLPPEHSAHTSIRSSALCLRVVRRRHDKRERSAANSVFLRHGHREQIVEFGTVNVASNSYDLADSISRRDG